MTPRKTTRVRVARLQTPASRGHDILVQFCLDISKTFLPRNARPIFHLGGERIEAARAVFVGAHGLALVLGGGLILLFILFGDQVAIMAASGAPKLAEMGIIYLRITVCFAPLLFVLSVIPGDRYRVGTCPNAFRLSLSAPNPSDLDGHDLISISIILWIR
ncbi:hypothetical protein [Yoonia sp. BS5-3]|uniref:Uncharacterized protein n=1 Tax=Yoonia phaeophyticola TaxID=3137369 RepID=A0ABZ2V557_9RHOB